MNNPPITLHVLLTESIFSRGGEKYPFELLRRVSRYYPVCLHVLTISPQWKRLYTKEQIRIDRLWRPHRLFWILLPITLLVNYVRLRRSVGQRDVVFSTSFPMNFLAVLLSRRTICHCAEPLAIFYDSLRIASLPWFSRLCVRLAKLMYARLDRWAFTSCSVLTSLNRSVEQHVLRIYGRKPDILLPNGVDTQQFSPSKNRHFKRTPLLGHSTDYTVFKGTNRFLRMLAHLHGRRVQFRAIISESITDPAMKQTYRTYITNHAIRHKVRFVGRLSEAALAAFYRKLDLFVFTGSPEGSGAAAASMSILEAQSCGVPVIRSIGDDRELVAGKTGYYIDPNNIKASGGAIQTFLCLPKSIKLRMGAAARQYVQKNFSWDVTAGVFLRTIQTIRG